MITKVIKELTGNRQNIAASQISKGVKQPKVRGSEFEGGRKTTDLLLYFTVLIITTILITGCKGKINKGKAQVERPSITGVRVSEVSISTIDDYYETSGTVKARNIATISSRMMGEVKAINVKEGDSVKAGQTLLIVDDMDINERIKAAEAGYKEALKGLEMVKQNRALVDITYKRYKRLHDEKAISQQELDQIETQKKVSDLEYERAEETVNRAKAALSEARVYHGYTRVTAPFSGVITEKRIERGSMAVLGSPLLTIEDTSSYQIVVNVDERFSGLINKGMPALILIDSLGLEIKGTISEVIPSVDPMSRTFIVKIDIKAPQLKSGLYGKVKIPVGKRETIIIPLRAVVEKGQLTGVYAVNREGIISFRPIRTGKTFGDNIEVLSGLNLGERIVTEGINRVIDGGVIR